MRGLGLVLQLAVGCIGQHQQLSKTPKPADDRQSVSIGVRREELKAVIRANVR